MAGHHWEDWFEREEFIGQISDIRVQNLQVEREVVQKRTFTRWMNLHLEKCDPPLQIQDLFQDIQDGHVLMALLEELSGCKLLHGFKRSAHRIFRLNNIAKVLSFLEERNVKLVSIDAADIADGNSSIILGLIWNIILFFQIKELTGNIRSQFPSSSSLSSIPTSSDSDTSFGSTPSEERQSAAVTMRENSKAIKKLLQWIQRRTRKYGVAVQDFGKSWTSGLAFLAVIKSIDSSLVDMRKALLRTPRENLEDAFRIAHYSLGIPRLLEPEGKKKKKKILDILSDSPHTVDVSNMVDVNSRAPGSDVLQDFGSPQQSFTHSPSSVPESLIGDSAINSPDSWMEGELNPDRFCESRSDSSFCDSGMAWDVYRATPVEVMPYDEGFVSSVEDRAPDESIIETYMDDHMSSLDRTDMQIERSQEEDGKEKQEDTQTQDQDPEPDLATDSRETNRTDETPLQTDKVPTEQKTLDERCEAEGLESYGSGDLVQKPDRQNHFEPIFSTEPPDEVICAEETPLKEVGGEGSYRGGTFNGQTESLEQRHRGETGAPGEEVEEFRNKSESLKDSAVERDSSERKESSGSETLHRHPANSGTAFKPSLTIPLISITSEPEEPDEEIESDPGALGQDEHEGRESSQGPDPPNSVCSKDDGQEPPEFPSSLIPENTTTLGDPESESGNDPGQQDGSHGTHSEGNHRDNRDKQEERFPGIEALEDGDVSARCPSVSTDDQHQNPDGVGRNQPDGHRDKPTQRETENLPDSSDSSQNILEPDSQKLNGQIGVPADLPRHLDRFSSDFDRSSPTDDLVGDRIEPMDLFYPDKEESILPEPPDTEMQRWPSVLSVSALQPAPPSDGPEDLQGEDFLSGGEHDHVRFPLFSFPDGFRALP
uniref:Calmin-like n=1 Tax=Fundulus heteroclitus TaxID=8078 RepID=A0A3Q2UJZ2_FUNHE